MKKYRGWNIRSFGLDDHHHPPEQLREICDEAINQMREECPDDVFTITHHGCEHEGLTVIIHPILLMDTRDPTAEAVRWVTRR